MHRSSDTHWGGAYLFDSLHSGEMLMASLPVPGGIPRIIDPASACVEVDLTELPFLCSESGLHAKRHIFWRLPPRWNYPLTDLPPNLFGNAKHFGQCSLLLGFDSQGALRQFYVKAEGEWAGGDIPEEANGLPLPRPSIRLLCSTEEECYQIVGLLDAFLDGGKLSEHECRWLRERLAAARDELRVIDVMPLQQDAK